MVTDPRASPATSAPSASSSRCPTLPPAAGRPTGRARAAPQGAPERRVGFKDERTARRPGAGDERLVRRISGPAGCAAPGRTSSEPVGGPPLLGRGGGRAQAGGPARRMARRRWSVREVFVRLAQWPQVAGAKPLRYDWKGHWRIRVGSFRVVFRIVAPNVLVVRIMPRSGVYED